MTLPPPLQALWEDLEAARRDLLREVDGLSQGQADWRSTAEEWSVGEILHHLLLAEINTGKLTTKLTRDAAGASRPFPPDLRSFDPLPPRRPGGGVAPALVRPDAGRPIHELRAELETVRQRTRQSIERLGTLDPRLLLWEHFAFGPLNIAQWWTLQAAHDREHLAQLRRVKAAGGFPSK
jgi:hypothetical protein